MPALTLLSLASYVPSHVSCPQLAAAIKTRTSSAAPPVGSDSGGGLSYLITHSIFMYGLKKGVFFLV